MGRINQIVAKSSNAILKQRGYEVEKVLGEGSFSVVKGAKWNKSGKEVKVALKIINRATAPDEFIEKFWPREEKVLNEVKHDNIIQMYEIFSEGNKIFICLEWASRGDLLQYLQLKGKLSEYETHQLFLQIVAAIDYLHKNNIVHRDLKCENVLLTQKNTGKTVKISDFGFAAEFNSNAVSKTFCGSAAYAPPEVLQGIPYKPTLHDVWSMGVILYIMTINAMPFRDSNIKKLVQDQQSSNLDFNDEKRLSKSYRDLVLAVLRYEQSKRFCLKDIQKHKWICGPPPDRPLNMSQISINASTSQK